MTDLEKFNNRMLSITDKLVEIVSSEAENYHLEEVINFAVYEDGCLPMIIKHRSGQSCPEDTSDFLKTYQSLEKRIRGNVMTTITWDYYRNDNGLFMPMIDILLSKSMLTTIMIACDDDDKILSGLRLSLKHEIGHVIDDINIINDIPNITPEKITDLHNELTEKTNKHYEAYEKMLKKYNINKESKLALLLYYKIPDDTVANKNVGITFERLWKASKMLGGRC